MLENFTLTEEYIQLFDGFDTWEEAITVSAKPLLDGGEIEQSYIDAMINSVKEYGPYIVIAPDIALPHARPETGSNKIGYSVMVTKNSVEFEDGSKAKLFIALSCVDSETHVNMLQSIVDILSDDSKQEKLLNATNKDDILSIFNKR